MTRSKEKTMTMIDVPLNQTLTRPSELIGNLGPSSFRTVVFDDDRNGVVFGTAVRDEVINDEAHIHRDFNETWIVLAGEIDFGIGDYPTLTAGAGDIVISPAGTVHLLTSASDETSIRLALAKHGSDHSIPGTRGPGSTPLPARTSPPNLVHTRPADVVAAQGAAPWARELIVDTLNRINLICTAPGDRTVTHAHPDSPQWWVVLQGNLVWEIDGREPVQAVQGDLVFVPAGTMHSIETVGGEDALRYSITPGSGLRRSFPDGSHDVYTPDLTGVPWSLA